MKNHTEMTDFEINQAVGLATGEATAGEPLLGIVIRNSNGKRFDPCTSWAAAGPIIAANKISIHAPRFGEGWMAEHTGSDEDVNDGFTVDYFEHHHQNPLRAAMIVFLMMQKAEDHHTKSS